jgi:hypothetical protein
MARFQPPSQLTTPAAVAVGEEVVVVASGLDAGVDVTGMGRGMVGVGADDDDDEDVVPGGSVDLPLAEPVWPSLEKESMAMVTISIKLALSSTSLMSKVCCTSLISDLGFGEDNGEGVELIDQPSLTNGELHR